MTARTNATVWWTIAGIVVVLTAVASGCLRDPTQVKWAASGVQVTRIEMPLARSGYIIVVGEYTLEGREGPEPAARTFRDRLLLTTHLRGREGQVLGFATRSYADGTTRAFSLSGTLRPVGPLGADPRVMVVAAWTHPVSPDGGPAGSRATAWVTLRLDPKTGHISTEAP